MFRRLTRAEWLLLAGAAIGGMASGMAAALSAALLDALSRL